MVSTEMTKKPNLQPLAQFVEENKNLVTMSAMRKWILNADTNGADMWIHRLGKNIAVDVDKFFEWTKRKV